MRKGYMIDRIVFYNRVSNSFTVNGQQTFDRNVVKDSWFYSVTSGQPGVQPFRTYLTSQNAFFAPVGSLRSTNRRVTFPPATHAYALLTLDYGIITRLVSATFLYPINDIGTLIRKGISNGTRQLKPTYIISLWFHRRKKTRMRAASVRRVPLKQNSVNPTVSTARRTGQPLNIRISIRTKRTVSSSDSINANGHQARTRSARSRFMAHRKQKRQSRPTFVSAPIKISLGQLKFENRVI